MELTLNVDISMILQNLDLSNSPSALHCVISWFSIQQYLYRISDLVIYYKGKQ